MSRIITVVGLDPSMNNFGMVKVQYNLDTKELFDPVLLLSESVDLSGAKTVRQNSKDLETAKSHYQKLTAFLEGATLVIAEVPVGSQSARAMASYGMCIGVLASIQLPLIQVTPNEVKIAATGNKTATKAEMIEWATKKFANADWFTVKRHGTISHTSKNEHLADALAAIYAGLSTSEFKLATAVISK